MGFKEASLEEALWR